MMSKRLDQLLELKKDNPTDSFLLFAIAKEYEKLEILDTALEYYLLLLSKDVDYIGTYYHLAKLYERKELNLEALKIYEKGILVAKKLEDQHSLSELLNAKMNLELEIE